MDLRDFLIEELVKVQERTARNRIDITTATVDEIREWSRTCSELYAREKALDDVAIAMLGVSLSMTAYVEWTRRIEDGPVLLDGEEAPEPIDPSILEFSDEEKDVYRRFVDDNTVVVDLTGDRGNATPIDYVESDEVGDLIERLSNHHAFVRA